MARSQISTLLCFFFSLKKGSPYLLFLSLFLGAVISICFPENVIGLISQKLRISTGKFTLLYTFFIWVNVAIYTFISLRESGLKDLLLYN